MQLSEGTELGLRRYRGLKSKTSTEVMRDLVDEEFTTYGNLSL